jgi:hypothetical protein
MPSNFQGTWQYARHSAKGPGVVQSPAKIDIADADNEPKTVTFTDSKGSPLSLTVDTKATHDISFIGKREDQKESYIGRLVILSASTPALLIGSISQTVELPADGDPLGPIGDTNIDVFIAVKTG